MSTLNEQYAKLTKQLDDTRLHLDNIAENYDIWTWNGTSDAIRQEFVQLTDREAQLSRQIGRLPLQSDIDAMKDPNYND